ncbi:MAG: phosphate ABC transporter substrate-binding protein [Lachnospiraceae bacterium]
MRLKKLFTGVLLATASLSLLACGTNKAGDSSSNGASETQVEQSSDSSVVTITGSTSVEKIVNLMKSEFEALNPGITIQYTGSGSSAGIKDTIAKTNNIGASSRELTDEEKAENMTETVFAYDGIAVAVNPANKVKDLTLEQLQKIYSGEITNWKEVGGDDAEIFVVSREESSGTRSAFEELIKLDETEGLTSNAAVSEGNGPAQIAIAGNENAVGYISFAYIDDTVKSVTVDSVEPTVENVKNKTYPLSRPFLFVSFDDQVSEAGKKFLEFAVSADGQACVEKDNAIRIDE